MVEADEEGIGAAGPRELSLDFAVAVVESSTFTDAEPVGDLPLIAAPVLADLLPLP